MFDSLAFMGGNDNQMTRPIPVENKPHGSTKELYEDVRDMMRGHTPDVARLWDKSPQYTARQGERPFHPEDYPNGRETPSVVEQFWSFIEANYEACNESTDVFWQRLNARFTALKLQKGKGKPCVAQLAGRVTSEFSDIVIGELERKPMQYRMQQACELQVAVANYVNGLMLSDLEDAADISERAS